MQFLFRLSLICDSFFQEEEKLVQRELVSIKDQVSSPNTSMVWIFGLPPFGLAQENCLSDIWKY